MCILKKKMTQILTSLFEVYFLETISHMLQTLSQTMIMYFFCFFNGHAQNFRENLSSKQAIISFYLKKAKDCCLSFLDKDIFCEKVKLLQMFIEKKLSVAHLRFSTDLYLKLIKLIWFGLCYFSDSVFDLNYFKFHLEMYIFKKLYGDNYPRYYLDKFQKAPLEKAILSKVSAKKKKTQF